MNSPLSRMIIAVLGGYVIILLLLSVHEWIGEKYPRPPTESPNTARIQHPYSHQLAVDALQRFSHLSNPEREAILENLNSNLISMEKWVMHLGQSDYQILCLGEFHRETTRQFLADEFFAHVRSDVLLLEATPRELKHLNTMVKAGRTYFPLLDADIMQILHTVRGMNPDIEIYGIEETDNQRKNRRDYVGARDKSIAGNFWERFDPGKRHIILIGAFHCTNQPNWLFDNLCGQVTPPLRNRMLNVQVLGEHQTGAVEAFVFFLDEIGIERKSFVLPDTRALHPLMYEWFHSLNRQTLESFRALVVFRI